MQSSLGAFSLPPSRDTGVLVLGVDQWIRSSNKSSVGSVAITGEEATFCYIDFSSQGSSLW